jgi:FMN phosphatase YigB (HAD superfamily)
MVKVVLFDLDGTLLPMDQDIFIKGYMTELVKKASPYGYAAEDLVGTVWKGTAAMMANDGSDVNKNVFWNVFAEKYGRDALKDVPVFDDFYKNEFELIKNSCGFNPKVNSYIKDIKAMGYRVALATNPVFPKTATQARIRWAGLLPEDFELYTTYETSNHSKPNPEYYRDVAKELGVSCEECLMVGNDVEEDMIAQTTGMKVFLITDCMINKKNKDISVYPNGSFEDLITYIKNL